jgi:Na+/phosphate symporter
MTLAALDGGIISFPASVAINMGANIGTTFTAFYASL